MEHKKLTSKDKNDGITMNMIHSKHLSLNATSLEIAIDTKENNLSTLPSIPCKYNHVQSQN